MRERPGPADLASQQRAARRRRLEGPRRVSFRETPRNAARGMKSFQEVRRSAAPQHEWTMIAGGLDGVADLQRAAEAEERMMLHELQGSVSVGCVEDGPS